MTGWESVREGRYQCRECEATFDVEADAYKHFMNHRQSRHSMRPHPSEMALVTDDTCHGFCRCPACGSSAFWTKFYKMHECADCHHKFHVHNVSEAYQGERLAARRKGR